MALQQDIVDLEAQIIAAMNLISQAITTVAIEVDENDGSINPANDDVWATLAINADALTRQAMRLCDKVNEARRALPR